MKDWSRPDGPHRVLVVDDDPRLLDATSTALAESGFRTRTASCAGEAIAELSRGAFEAVVLDVELPDASGFDVHRALQVADPFGETAVIFMSGRQVEEAAVVRALESGACDYMRKPFGIDELRARLRTAIGARRTIAELRRRASVDELTGLLNRRAFFDALERERRRATRDGTTLALIVLDVDRFKEVNDTHGHAAGDAALRAVATVLVQCCRVTDVAGRIGGEEFVLALPSTDHVGATQLAEKLRLAISALAIPVDGRSIALTASFGTAAAHGDHLGQPDGALTLLALADAALYRAKRAGRDRVEAA